MMHAGPAFASPSVGTSQPLCQALAAEMLSSRPAMIESQNASIRIRVCGWYSPQHDAAAK